MRKVLCAALVVCLAAPSLAFAQPDGPAPEVFLEDWPDQSNPGGFRFSGEYLLWWFKNGSVPPLVTAGGDGVLGSPGTRVLLDDLDFDDDVRHGGRFSLGYQFAANPCIGVEAGFFFVANRQSAVRFSASDDPILVRPFFSITTGAPGAFLVNSPGEAAGTIIVESSTSLWGADANLTAARIASDRFHLTALAGFRFLKLEDELKISDPFLTFGNTVGLQDEFRTDNCFYGGQVGLESGLRFGRLAVDFRSRLALGLMHQVAEINGYTNVLSPTGTTTIFQGGLLALRSNIGRRSQDELAFIPEVGLNLGWQWTPWLKLTAGYSFLWISTLARAGEQIDPVVNESQFPIRAGGAPLVGPARPAFNFVETDFWAQGLNFGLELRY
jgi:hypothetical protein